MTYQLRDLKDQVVVITGATAGMGAATAKELVEQGAKVVLNARNEARLKEIVASLGEANATSFSSHSYLDPVVYQSTVLVK